MAEPVTFAICGLGIRGMEAYASFQKLHPEKMRITALAEPNAERLALAKAAYSVPDETCFATAEELLAQPKLARVLIIATQDAMHVAQAVPALEKGYDLVLEKPISPRLDECLMLERKAQELGRTVIVCHVLRYTAFYQTLKEMLEKNAVGKVQTITAEENIAYWHYAHSYVRGNWRRMEDSSPMIMAKCCHDMDILRWLAGAACQRVSSFGGLGWFKPENAPKGSGARCVQDCCIQQECPYDAEKIYLTNPRSGLLGGNTEWPVTVLAPTPTEDAVRTALAKGPYGRCVYACDNDVADHQVVNMNFEGGITASFTVSAFTQECYRAIKITGAEGEIEADMLSNTITLRRFGLPAEVTNLGTIADRFAGHGGGDARLMEDVCSMMQTGRAQSVTSIEASVESHVMALAAEHSRQNGGMAVELEAFRAEGA